MKTAEIYTILDEIAPFSDAENWDNCGVLVDNKDFDSITLTLDLDEKILEFSENNTLFITHHPLIFKGLKALSSTKYPSSLVFELAKKNCSLIAMHTNYDKHALNDFVLSEVLGIKEYEKNGFICEFIWNSSFDELAKKVKNAFEIKHLRVVKSSEHVEKVAFCTGSGADLIGSFEADCFLTGDLKYHTAFEARHDKLSLIDIEHYASEKYFAQSLEKALKKYGISAKIANSLNPFSYM